MNLSIKEINELIYSLGITASKGMMCDKELNVSLLDKLQCELNYRIGLEAIDEEIEVSSHYVSNEEADEDAITSAQNDEIDRYESYVENDYDTHLINLKKRGYITQALLDYVDRKGAVSHGELETFYKSITGSNSFSHVLKSLRTPYKNRPTQRYVAKEGKDYTTAKYIIKIANPSNWVVVDDVLTEARYKQFAEEARKQLWG